MFRHTYIDKSGKLLCDVQQYVSRHNLVHKTPPYKTIDGLPLGNGFMGGLVYNTERELCMRINRPDSFDYGPKENFGAWSFEWEEKCTTLANCGVLKLSDGTPAFAWEYLNDYDMTLDLSRAEIRMKSETPFANYRAVGYGSPAYGCIVWEVSGGTEEPVERTVDLERYGTRGFFHYYESITRDTSRRLYGVESGIREGCMFVTQRLNGCTFTTAACVTGDGAAYSTPNSRTARCTLPASDRADFRVYITTALSRDGGDTVGEAIARLHAAVNAGDAVRRSALDWWHEYWNRSFISIADDTVENLYYINCYQFACAGLGEFPPSVFASIWNAFGDSRNWGHYYHWNDQMQFWPCDAWNHPELEKSYFAFRRRMLDNAVADCRRYHGVEGAWYSDIADAQGYQAFEPDTGRNMSCGAMISLQMYRHYRHYLNRDFLLNTAYPVMKACADMYMNLFVREEDGRYHLHDVTPMEGYLYINDTVSDWACARALFMALLDAADAADAPKELRDRWQDALDNLYEPPTYVVNGREILAHGRYADGSVCTSTVYPESGMGAGNVGFLMCVFPAATFGKWSGDEKYRQLIANTVEFTRGAEPTCGWDTIMQCYARFGLAGDLKHALPSFIRENYGQPNGLASFVTHYADNNAYKPQIIPQDCKTTDWNNIHEKDRNNRIVYRADRFDHFYSEPEAGVSTAVNESLVQSWEGRIRVFPAYDEPEGLFRLHAEGDFMVTSQKDSGVIRFVSVESGSGSRLNVVSPFDKMECVRTGGREVPFELSQVNGERIISLDTVAGETYVIFSKACHIDGSYPTVVPTDLANTAPKTGRLCRLGLERDF